jgi:hypothetical protein
MNTNDRVRVCAGTGMLPLPIMIAALSTLEV